MKGTQRKKPRPFVAARQALNTPNLKRNPINRSAYQEKKEDSNDENQGTSEEEPKEVPSPSTSTLQDPEVRGMPEGVTIKTINKPTEESARILDETTSDEQSDQDDTSSLPSTSQPADTHQPLVNKLKQFPIILTKPRSTNALSLVARSNLSRGTLVLREDPYSCTIDTLFNGTHCACCMSPLGNNRVLCQGCGLVYYCSSKCCSGDKVMHTDSGECTWCVTYRGAASTADHTLTRLTLRYLKAQDSIEPLERKLMAKVQRYGQWASQLSANLSPEALKQLGPVIAMWRTRLQALKRQLLLASRACPHIDPAPLAVALHLLAVCAVRVRDLGGKQQALALYGLANLFQHSCDPNVQLVFVGKTLEARCLREVKVGETLTVSFTELYAPRRVRQEQLLNNFGLMCTCARCKKVPSNRYVESEMVMAEWKQSAPSTSEEKEALREKWVDRMTKLRQAVAISQAGKPEILPKVKAAAAALADECATMLHPHHQLLHQVQLLQLEIGELSLDWELVLDLGPGLLQQVESTHPAHHALVAWISRKLAMALHWLSENTVKPILQRALDYADEALCVLQVACGPDHDTTREVWALGHVLRRKLSRA